MLTREQMARLELEIEARKIEQAALRRYVRAEIEFVRYLWDIDRLINSVQRTIRRL